MSEYLKRKIDKYLFDWKTNPNHKPLIIKGARQVGKTKSIENFAKRNYESIVEINFAEDPVYKQIKECQDPHAIFNIHGGNNLIAPTASQAEQKLV